MSVLSQKVNVFIQRPLKLIKGISHHLSGSRIRSVH